jgi:CysZ protein
VRSPSRLWYAALVADDLHSGPRLPDGLALPPEGSLPPAAPVARPGAIRRLGAGAWHVVAGFGFLARRPRLWPLALLPAILTAVCLAAGLVAAVYSMHRIESALVPGPDKIGPALGFLLTLLVWIGTLISGLVFALAAAMLLSAPVLEQLSLKVDALVRGAPIDRSKGWRWELAQSFRGTLYFLVAAPGVFLLSLIPVVGPPLALLWGAYALAFQQTDAALARRGLGFADRRAWHRYWNLESMGFGVTGLLTLIVPLANLLVVPALAVGGTLLVLELEDQLIPADVPSRRAR